MKESSPLKQRLLGLVTGLGLALALPLLAQTPTIFNNIQLNQRLGVAASPFNATVETVYGGPLPFGVIAMLGNTGGDGAEILMIPNEAGIDVDTRRFSIGVGANGSNGEWFVSAPWGLPIEIFSDAGGASGIVSLGVPGADYVNPRSPMRAPNGDETMPSYSFLTQPLMGLYLDGTTMILGNDVGNAGSHLDLGADGNATTLNSGEDGGGININSAFGLNLNSDNGQNVTVSPNTGGFTEIRGPADSVRSLHVTSPSGIIEFTSWNASSQGQISFTNDLAVAAPGLLAGSSLILDAGGGTDELTVSSGGFTFNGTVTTANTSASEVGYKGIPQNIQAGNYGIVLTDAATHIYHASGAGAGDTYTIPANGSVAFPIGSVLTFVNDDTDSLAIAITTDTLTLAGTTDTAPCTMTENSIATALKVTSTSWLINGTGITC